MKKYIYTVVLFLMMVAVHPAMAGLSSVVATASPSSTTINHPVYVQLSISNTSASQLTVTNILLTATSTAAPGSSRLPMAVSVWAPNLVSPVIAANLTTQVTAGPVVFFSPSTGITGSGTGTYTIGAQVYTSDGAVTNSAFGGAVTINPIPLPAYERQ